MTNTRKRIDGIIELSNLMMRRLESSLLECTEGSYGNHTNTNDNQKISLGWVLAKKSTKPLSDKERDELIRGMNDVQMAVVCLGDNQKCLTVEIPQAVISFTCKAL